MRLWKESIQIVRHVEVDYEKFGCPQLSLEIKNIWKMVQDTLNPSTPPHLSLASKNEGVYPLENKIVNFPLPSQHAHTPYSSKDWSQRRDALALALALERGNSSVYFTCSFKSPHWNKVPVVHSCNELKTPPLLTFSSFSASLQLLGIILQQNYLVLSPYGRLCFQGHPN